MKPYSHTMSGAVCGGGVRWGALSPTFHRITFFRAYAIWIWFLVSGFGVVVVYCSLVMVYDVSFLISGFWSLVSGFWFLVYICAMQVQVVSFGVGTDSQSYRRTHTDSLSLSLTHPLSLSHTRTHTHTNTHPLTHTHKASLLLENCPPIAAP